MRGGAFTLGDDELNARDDELASSEVAGFVGGLGEVTRMDLEKKHGNGTREGLGRP